MELYWTGVCYLSWGVTEVMINTRVQTRNNKNTCLSAHPWNTTGSRGTEMWDTFRFVLIFFGYLLKHLLKERSIVWMEDIFFFLTLCQAIFPMKSVIIFTEYSSWPAVLSCTYVCQMWPSSLCTMLLGFCTCFPRLPWMGWGRMCLFIFVSLVPLNEQDAQWMRFVAA